MLPIARLLFGLSWPRCAGALMDASQFWIRFVLATLATWRLTHLLVSEDGPADIIARLRNSLAGSIAGGLFDCFGCLSLCVAIPLAFFVSTRPLEILVTWLALSGAAFLIERMTPEPVVIENIPEAITGGAADAMLQSETSITKQTVGDGRIEPEAGQRLTASS
jgi:hypothetical protein